MCPYPVLTLAVWPCNHVPLAPTLYVLIQALEYQVQQGIVGGAKEELLLMPLMPRHVMGPELHSNVAVLRLMQEF